MKPKLAVLGFLVLSGLLYGAYRSWWSSPVAEARADLAEYRKQRQKTREEISRGLGVWGGMKKRWITAFGRS